jgi:homoserine dehydrogenase
MKIQPVFLLGFGGVGRALARQICNARELHEQRNKLRLDIMGIADSTGVILDSSGFCDPALTQLIDRKLRGEKLTTDRGPSLTGARSPIPSNAIVVDTTATDATVPILLEAQARGCGVVLANKKPLAGPINWFDAITAGKARANKARWETTCGSALPVISTLDTLLNSGDQVTRIEGTLSGTLGYISSQLEAGVPFGDAVRDAKARGYTEPDPRQDLGGLDVARKALILARMLGYRLEMSDVKVESLYPAAMDALSVDAFMAQVDSLNAPMAAQAAALMRGNKTLRYAATIENGHLSAGLVGVDRSTKLGSTRTSDSAVIFTTKYFSDNPVAITGRGAGQEVTASGCLGDVVSLAKEM